MRVVTDRTLAKDLSVQARACFFSNNAGKQFDKTYVIGRKYRGLFDESDGSYVTIATDPQDKITIDRDAYGSIPLFYSTIKPLVSTDIRVIIEIDHPEFDSQSLAEYLSTAYLTGGKTIYKTIRTLLPNQVIKFSEGKLKIENKNIFPNCVLRDETEISQLLEKALTHSIEDLLSRYPKKLLLNLSGGADSTLILAKIREKNPSQEVFSSTYFHSDWREDLNDWEYAKQASEHFGSHHQLINIHNVIFADAHRDLVRHGQNVFHTYAAAFYLQNLVWKDVDLTIPIINGSGPDESIIGTEKIEVSKLLSLKSVPKIDWVSYLIKNIDYIKIAEPEVMKLLKRSSNGFLEHRKMFASTLLDAPDFVEFQRRYHAMTILQDHIQEITAAAQVLTRPIIFPYLTNDIFKIIFSSSFETLNKNGIYKSVVKNILEKYMPKEFVHRKKIGFQSPSRPYFKSEKGLGSSLANLLEQNNDHLLNLPLIKVEIKKRLDETLNLFTRYDFLEWTTYNFLLLQKLAMEQTCLNSY